MTASLTSFHSNEGLLLPIVAPFSGIESEGPTGPWVSIVNDQVADHPPQFPNPSLDRTFQKYFLSERGFEAV
jgi:hypothetical protein